MKTLIALGLTISSLLACRTDEQPIVAYDTPVMTTTTNKLSYLALGDSYTIGEAVEQKDSFPFQLSSLLVQSYGVQPPTVIARTGWTADNLISAISTSGLIGKQYDIVTLLIGVNDQYQGLSQTNYRTKFVQLLNTAITFSKSGKSRVFVVSIPDYGVTPFAGGKDDIIGPQIDQFNAINKEESDKAGVNYVNITQISKQVATDKTLVAADGLHPSAAMYALWVTPIASAVIKQLVP